VFERRSKKGAVLRPGKGDPELVAVGTHGPHLLVLMRLAISNQIEQCGNDLIVRIWPTRWQIEGLTSSLVRGPTCAGEAGEVPTIPFFDRNRERRQRVAARVAFAEATRHFKQADGMPREQEVSAVSWAACRCEGIPGRFEVPDDEVEEFVFGDVQQHARASG
jgi:hypothetical protein